MDVKITIDFFLPNEEVSNFLVSLTFSSKPQSVTKTVSDVEPEAQPLLGLCLQTEQTWGMMLCSIQSCRDPKGDPKDPMNRCGEVLPGLHRVWRDRLSQPSRLALEPSAGVGRCAALLAALFVLI